MEIDPYDCTGLPIYPSLMGSFSIFQKLKTSLAKKCHDIII